MMNRTLIAACTLALTLGAAAQTARPNPHETPAPDPKLLENPPTGTPPPGPGRPDVEAKPVLTRRDLALAYMRFERALAVAAPKGEALADVSGAVDEATMAFFRGDKGAAIGLINHQTVKLMGEQAAAAGAVAERLRVRVEPPVWTYFTTPAPVIVVRSIAPFGASSPAALPGGWPKLAVLLDKPGTDAPIGGEAASVQLSIPAPNAESNGELRATLDLSPLVKDLRPGRYDVWLTGENGFRWNCGAWYVVTASRGEVRRLDLDLMDKYAAPADRPDLGAAATTLRARMMLLSDRPSEEMSVGMVTDQVGLESDVLLEYSALQQGRNPYARRTGTYYRAYTSGGIQVPLWVHAPPGAAKDEPMPLVIAMHGAGADEAMFMYGYGAGMIRDLADRKQFIVASPLAYAFATNPAVFDDLVASMERDYRIDPRRIYVVGHSLGAIAASGLAQARCDRIAAVAAIAGLRPFQTGKPGAPVVAFAAALDTLVPPERVHQAADAAKAAGISVEVRDVPDVGHTLVVPAVLPGAVDWLLSHTLPEAPADKPK